MTKSQITLKEALKLVSFQLIDGEWHVKDVKYNVYGNVRGNVWGNVGGNVGGNVFGNVDVVKGNVGTVCGDVKCNVRGDVGGDVKGTIDGKKWQFVETPREKLTRLIEESDESELLKILDKLENN